MANAILDGLLYMDRGDDDADGPAAEPRRGLSDAEKVALDAVLLEIGAFTYEELARARGIHPHTVHTRARKVRARHGDALDLVLRRVSLIG